MFVSFEAFSSLFSIPDISKLDTKNIIFDYNLFNGFLSLIFIPKLNINSNINLDCLLILFIKNIY